MANVEEGSDAEGEEAAWSPLSFFLSLPVVFCARRVAGGCGGSVWRSSSLPEAEREGRGRSVAVKDESDRYFSRGRELKRAWQWLSLASHCECDSVQRHALSPCGTRNRRPVEYLPRHHHETLSLERRLPGARRRERRRGRVADIAWLGEYRADEWRVGEEVFDGGASHPVCV